MDRNGLESESVEAEVPPQKKVTKATGKYSKVHFIELLTLLEVVNGQQYKTCLVENDELRQLCSPIKSKGRRN